MILNMVFERFWTVKNEDKTRKNHGIRQILGLYHIWISSNLVKFGNFNDSSPRGHFNNFWSKFHILIKNWFFDQETLDVTSLKTVRWISKQF